ncbi:MAG: hypothetical protein AB7O26_06150 [Planctomycetaceae bacterium]
MSFAFLSSWMLPLAAAEEGVLHSVEYDLPGSATGWTIVLVELFVAITLIVLFYFRDTRSLSRFWTVFLSTLRLGVLAGLIVIAVNPQERTQKMSYRPSRAVILVDTSLSMRYPESMPKGIDSTNSTVQLPSRADAVKSLLADSTVVQELRKQHELSIYTFDSSLSAPQHVFPWKDPRGTPTLAGTEGNASAPGVPNDSSENSTEKPVDWNAVVEPRGLETRLGESLLEAIRQTSGRTLAGIVVVTDGDSNAGVDPATAHEIARSSKTRIVAVGVGSTEQPVNLQVATVQAPTDVHIGDPYEISAFVQGQGLAGQSVDVELLARPDGEESAAPTTIDKRQVTLREDGIPVELKFEQTPSVAGAVEYFIRAKTIGGVRELSADDNERRKTINIIDRKMKVLLLAGGPMRDYGFVRNMLHRHSAVGVDVWLQTVEPKSAGQVSQDSDNLLIEFPKTAADLFQYDVIVAFDPDWTRLTPEARKLLVDWVSDHAGGLILVAGDVYTPQLASNTEELSQIKELYPVFLNASYLELRFETQSDQAWPVGFTREGNEAGFLQLTDDAAVAAREWKEFPGVYRCYPTVGPKAGATVYAHFSDPRAASENGQPILLASQFYGSGRTLYFGSAEMWRLRALGDEYYDRLWTKTIREVGQGRLRRGAARGTLLMERNQYVLGQTVRVRAHLLNPQMEPMAVDGVPFDVFDPTGKPLTAIGRMQRDKERPGQYTGDFRAGMPGTYRVVVRPEQDGKEQLTTKVDVVLPNLESDDPRQNVRLLTDLARDTGGQYLKIEEAAAKIPALLPNSGEEFLLEERLRTLWDRQWLMFLLVGLLSLEWLTRKLLKLA